MKERKPLNKGDTLVRTYLTLYKALNTGISLTQAVFSGLSLGLLSREQLERVDELYYTTTSYYTNPTYLRSGLFVWEQQMVEAYFQGRKRILVTAAGAGREMLALHRMGHDVEGFECNPHLIDHAHTLFREENLDATVLLAPRDEVPPLPTHYDAIIVGWSAYMLIQGREHRIAFLRALRELLPSQAPILLSFYARSSTGSALKLTAAIANTFRKVLRRPPVEVGDGLRPNAVHAFTRDEIASELRAAGFELEHFGVADSGYAVGFAV